MSGRELVRSGLAEKPEGAETPDFHGTILWKIK